jgi:hypothetical protein
MSALFSNPVAVIVLLVHVASFVENFYVDMFLVYHEQSFNPNFGLHD